MDASPSALAKILLPKLPFILKTTALHTLSLSSTSSKWDLKTELIIKVLRDLLNPAHPRSIHSTQKVSMRDSGVKGRMWVSRVTIQKPPEDDLRQTLFMAIDDMKEGAESYLKPDTVPIEAEWTGYRTNVADNAPEPSISEGQKYENLMKEIKSDVTVLYFHGGAYYLMDPSTHRLVTSKLAKITGGRVLSVRYRLAPQNPFPSQLLDALLSYLYLICPPEGSSHKPVPASNIVFAGDSAGGNLSLALLQLLLQLHRNSSSPIINFHGQPVPIPLPAGVAVSSPWLDVNRCMPSIEENAKYDYLPPPSATENVSFPPDDIWPAKPPRVDLFCEGSALCHPLVSPLAAMDWKNAPAIFITCGEEMLADENYVLARRLAGQGVKVVWEQYEAMPHCFAMMLEGHAGASMCMQKWGETIKGMVEKPDQVKTVGTWVTAKKLQRKDVDIKTLIEISDEDVVKRMKESRDKRVEAFQRGMKSTPAEPKL